VTSADPTGTGATEDTPSRRFAAAQRPGGLFGQAPNRFVRLIAFAALAAALGVYYAIASSLWDGSTWWDVAFIALVLFPAVFGLVWLALPLRTAPHIQLFLVGLGFAAAAAALHAADLIALSSFAKLGATTILAFWFLRYFESVVWVALVAALVPWVDIYSVFWGPTSHLIEHPGGVAALSFAFRFPGEDNYATLGIPDLLFFALFLAAAARFRLRVAAAWVAMITLLGATIALAVWLDLRGLPALPALSLGFLAPNADRIWRTAQQVRFAAEES
jgi:hypothetical protein